VESRCFASTAEGRSMSRPRRHTSLSCGDSDTGSTSPNRPSRAHTTPTPPRRNRWDNIEITEHADSQPQPRIENGHSTGQHAEAFTGDHPFVVDSNGGDEMGIVTGG